ncbi:MAG: ParA family protein [Deltaproteobacteria bacterium]|nr:ParA family protein [bacterium]MCB9475902.1 ParA family protein [Deltaproteobacteria bacterium]MCB9479705.1 ParA family protein [Deltaproteobacteria bacterium]MCB9488036.1 ParA family protein [Deltaproteobacteria bacterium]
MRKIAFVNEKGGSCKTTLAVNMASYLAGVAGKKVLLIDTDPQGQSGKCLGMDVKSAPATTLELLLDPALSVKDAVQPTRIDGLDIIVANKTLGDFQTEAAHDEDRAERLKAKIQPIRGYDYVVFDSPPSLGLLTLNVMVAASEIVVPVSLTYLALDGCAEIVDTVESVKKDYGHGKLKISLVVPVLYRNTRLANAILEKLGEYFGDKLSSTRVGYNVAIDEAQSMGRTIWEYAPNSRGAQALEAFAQELIAAGS